jgi:hypothetical protein
MQVIDLTKEGAQPYTQISAPALGILELLSNSRAGWYIDDDVYDILIADQSQDYYRVDLYR